jgi:hypothetical protein
LSTQPKTRLDSRSGFLPPWLKRLTNFGFSAFDINLMMVRTQLRSHRQYVPGRSFLPQLILFNAWIWAVCLAVSPGRAAESGTARIGVGDGVADDTAAIQRAIQESRSAIRLAPGNYRLTQTIEIDLEKTGFVGIHGDGVARIVMEGSGPAFRLVGTHAGTADPKTVEPQVWDRQRMPLIDGLEIVGQHPEACGIEAAGTMQLTLTRLVIRRTRHAVHLVQRNRNVLIADCHLYENHGVGIYLDNVDLHQINVNACHISYNAQGGIVSLGGNVRNLQVNGCDIESNMSPETPPTANILIDCSRSSSGTAEVAISGCTIQHNSKSKDSANIRILGRGSAIVPNPSRQWGNVAIVGNVLSDVACNIQLSDCRGVTVQGNTFWMGYQHNLLVEKSSHIVIGPNNFDRNPSYTHGNASTADNAIVFRQCQDCTLTGLHVSQVLRQPAAILIEDSRRMNISSCTILDSDGVGLLLRQVHQSLVSGCLIADDRQDRPAAASLRIDGGSGNQIFSNALQHGLQQDHAPPSPP